MAKDVSRRDVLKGAASAASYLAVGGLPAPGLASEPREPATPAAAPVTNAAPANGVLTLDSTSGVILPPRGDSFQKFSFGFPEPSVVFNGLSLSFRLYTFENVYGLDRDRMHVTRDGDALVLECDGLVWAGGQQKTEGALRSRIRSVDGAIEWDVSAGMAQPIKSVAAIVRGVPRGRIAPGSEGFFDPGEDEVLLGYPWGATRQRQARGINTPLAVIEAGDGDCFFLSALMDQVRAARFYFQPGDDGYRVELVYEQAGWNRSNRLEGITWRAGRTHTADEAFRRHFQHVERAFHLPTWEARSDVPAWFREIALVLSIHGMHWTGYIFNDFAKALRTLEWTAGQIAPEKVMVFLPAWDGRYYWNYPTYRVDERLGGEEGFRRLIREGQRMGFHFVPMFGLNAANTELANYAPVADASTREIDGNTFGLTWVDWDNDRHDEGWGRYMNVGVEAWRRVITDRIANVIDRYGVDGYFLDIAGGWVNNGQADMHEGLRRLVADLRARYPHVLPVGEFSYDALQEILPVYHIFPASGYPVGFEKYCRTFSHLSHPAPGRGSSGVHESGFNRFDPATLSLSPHQIPTITIVDDTFDRHRDVMAGIIQRARERASRRAQGL